MLPFSTTTLCHLITMLNFTQQLFLLIIRIQYKNALKKKNIYFTTAKRLSLWCQNRLNLIWPHTGQTLAPSVNVPAPFQNKSSRKRCDILYEMLTWGIYQLGEELRDNRLLVRLSHNQAACVGSLLRLIMCLEPWCRQKERGGGRLKKHLSVENQCSIAASVCVV